MSIYKVKQGDCLSSIAHQQGFHWKTLWNHPENQELREKRKHPNILYPGDEVFVPEKEEKYESVATARKHTFQVKNTRAKLCIQVLRDGQPWADEEYTLEVDGKKLGPDTQVDSNQANQKKGKSTLTNSNGILKHWISQAAKAGKLLIGKESKQREFPLKIGHLDPIDEISGVQARLKNLMLYQGPIDGNKNEALKQAVAVFQGYAGLEVTGELSQQTESPQGESVATGQKQSEGDFSKKLEVAHDTSNIPKSPFSIMPPSILKGEEGEEDYYVSRSVNNECNTFDCRTVVAIDAHMHVMSGHCTPAPLIDKLFYDKIRGKVKILGIRKRQGGLGLSKLVDLGIGKKCTSDIAKQAIEDNDNTYKKLKKTFHEYKNCELFTPMVALCMDFEYAHVKGYEGKTIYYYYDDKGERRNYYGGESPSEVFFMDFRGEERKLRNKARQLPKQESAKNRGFEPWQEQLKQTIQAVTEHPWKLLPMFHYEPRRWIMDEEWKKRTSEKQPFEEVATSSQPGLFVGFKMYTSLGYKPLDPKLPGMLDFYGKCAGKQIPIMAHCTPGGSYTHERELYLDLEEEDGVVQQYQKLLEEVNILEMIQEIMKRNFKNIEKATEIPPFLQKIIPLPKEAIQGIFGELQVLWGSIPYSFIDGLEQASMGVKVKYFNDHFVRPTAWCSVLTTHNNLRLCLAHVGGNPQDYSKGPANRLIKRFSKKLVSQLADILANKLVDSSVKMVAKQAIVWFVINPLTKKLANLYEYDKWVSEVGNLCVTYPNVYTDISDMFHTQSNRKFVRKELLRKFGKRILYKVMFGTDWYVTKISGRLFDFDYYRYCLKSKKFLDKLTKEFRENGWLAPDEDLWTLFTVVNPFRYLGFVQMVGNQVQANMALIKNVDAALKAFNSPGNDGKVFDELQRNTEIITRTAEGVAHYLNANEERRKLVTWQYMDEMDSPIDIPEIPGYQEPLRQVVLERA